MGFAESYLGRLRSRIGSELVLAPGAQVVVQIPGGNVLLQRRTDSGLWEIPAGSAEPGQSFATAAVSELYEETGIAATAEALEPFASLSDPDVHVVTYPNGDRIHAFALCFLLRLDEVPPVAGRDGEAIDHAWHDPLNLPNPMYPPTEVVLKLLREYRATSRFQAR